MPTTLLYLASGPYRRSYENLPFDQVILVDRDLIRFPRARPENSKVNLLRGDALPAIQKLKKRDGIKIDCLVSVNEGLCEGGGDYPIFSDFLLGYLSPILADELIVITDINYYTQTEKIGDRVAQMDWGFESVRIDSSHPKYLDPKLFTNNRVGDNRDYGDVFLLKRKKSKVSLPLNDQLSVDLIHGSIWEDEADLNLIGLHVKPKPRVREKYDIESFFKKNEKVDLIRGAAIEDILSFAEERHIKHLGLTPWMKEDYHHVIEVLRTYQPKHLEKISFYHLRKDDYKMLYELATKQATGLG